MGKKHAKKRFFCVKYHIKPDKKNDVENKRQHSVGDVLYNQRPKKGQPKIPLTFLPVGLEDRKENYQTVKFLLNPSTRLEGIIDQSLTDTRSS